MTSNNDLSTFLFDNRAQASDLGNHSLTFPDFPLPEDIEESVQDRFEQELFALRERCRQFLESRV